MPNRAACLFGALVADAAAMGLHWLYDPARIAQVAPRSAAFVPPDPAHFSGVPAYFAHGARQNGQLTQYGEGLLLAIRHLRHHKTFDTAKFQSEFAAHFGPGGPYAGYIDSPTRITLANLAAGQTTPSGAQDDQLPALIRLPALVATGADAATLNAAMEVTNTHPTATACSPVCATLLADVLAGAPVADALHKAAATAPGDIGKALRAALDTAEANPVAYGEITGRACHLPMGLPLAFHIMAHSADYAQAVETNIRAGGDSAGRAILIGAVMAAAGGVQAIPLEWALRLHDGAAIWDDCCTIAPSP